MASDHQEDADANRTDWSELRSAFVKHELRRHRLASNAVLLIALLTLLFLAASVFNKISPPTWQSIALICFISICVALPLLSKLSISKDGGGFDIANPIEMLDRMEAKAEAARSESFEQTRLQIGALSVQLSELAASLSRTSPATRPENVDAQPQGEQSVSEPNLRTIRKLLPKPSVEDDPQKNRFGGSASNDTRVLSARISKSNVGKKWYSIIITLASSDGSILQGNYAYFFLHDTFDPDVYRVKIPPNSHSVDLDTTAVGAFTVGVVADRGVTKLELDLSSDAVSAPLAFKNN